MISNKELNLVVSEQFIIGRKLNIFLVFITQSYFPALRNITLNYSHYFIMKITNKKEH